MIYTNNSRWYNDLYTIVSYVNLYNYVVLY